MFEVTENPVLPELVINRVKRDINGANVIFIGSLRGYSSGGNKVLYAECDSDKKMSEQQLRDVGEEIRAKWQLEDVSICHRVGRIEVGETIAVVAIAAPNRQEAFDACQYAVDRFKEFMVLKEVLENQ